MGRRLPLQRAVRRPPRRRHPDDQAPRRRRHRDRAQGRLKVLAGEVVDGTFISAAALDAFLAEQVARAKAEDVLFSVHLKATMMKVSDPIIFGHVVRAYFADVYAAYGERCWPPASTAPTAWPPSSPGSTPRERRGDQGRLRARPGRRPAPGDGQLRQGHHRPPRPQRRHRRRLDAGDDPHLRPHVGPRRPRGRHPRRHPRLLLCRRLSGRHRRLPGHGAYDPTTMGSVPNVGLMAQKAEEYGSHDKTFEMSADGHRAGRQPSR
jgi:isocitrate dehydrogenase